MNWFSQVILMLSLASVTFAQTFWEPTSGPAKGAIWSILTMPDGEIFVGTDSGGVYRSLDKGETWFPSNENLNTKTVFRIIRSPDGDVLLGTHNGIYRSTDGGFWTFISTDLPEQSLRVVGVNSENHIFTGMPVASRFISGDGGLYRSIDKGETWSRIALTEHVNEAIAQRPNADMILFSHISGGTTINTYRYVSQDSGRTWNRDFFGSGGVVRGELAFDSNGNMFWIDEYGLMRNSGQRVDWIWDCGKPDLVVIGPEDLVFSGGDQGLCYSNDRGDTWMKVDGELTQLSALAFDPDGFLYCGNSDGIVYRSTQVITKVQETDSQTPVSFVLFQNYPNPFNGSTEITYQLPGGRPFYRVKLEIYDIEGRLVSRLIDTDQLPGTYSVICRAKTPAANQ